MKPILRQDLQKPINPIKMRPLLPPTATLLAVAFAFFTFMPMVALCQNCSCSPELCCSRHGYCGSGEEYCGSGCQQGNCFAQAPTNGVAIHNIVTRKFFNGIITQSDSTCVGRRFYSRSSFITALKHFPRFGRIGSINDTKREVAAFFAHVTHETGHFCYIDEINGTTRDYCDETNTEYKCVKDKSYHGRGPIQLSWNFNYGPAGKSLKFDGLNEPEKVAEDPVLSFKTALWYWMNFVQSKMSEGFGSTIKAINNMECGRNNDTRVFNRIRYYQDYCSQLHVLPGRNLTC